MTTNNLLRFQWNEDAESGSRIGEGVSRPKASARTKQFRLRVKPKDAPAMIWTTFAESKRRAESYARARWPDCGVEHLALP